MENQKQDSIVHQLGISIESVRRSVEPWYRGMMTHTQESVYSNMNWLLSGNNDPLKHPH